VEFALVWPLLLVLLVLVVDFGRVFYFHSRLTNCAQNGALWASDPLSRTQSRYKTVEEAAKADFPARFQDKLKVKQNPVNPREGEEVEVTAEFDFSMFMSVLSVRLPILKVNFGVPEKQTLSRSVRMRVSPLMPLSSPNPT
jgi:hypothetical protein